MDFNKWIEGFDELEDIFEFIASSPYFDWRIFQLDSLNHINKERNLKRNSYMTFLKWIEKNALDKEYDFEKKEFYLPKIIETFPESNLEMEIRRVEYEYCKKLYIKSKFNGKEIIKRFGYTGKLLGEVMKEFKDYAKGFNKNNSFDEWVLENDIDEIYFRFGEFVNSSNWKGLRPEMLKGDI